MGKLIHLKQAEAEPRRERLTKTIIDNLEYDPDGGSWQVVWDTDVDNLGVRIGKRSKRWVLRYRARGRQRLWTIGPTTQHPVKQAREIARDANAGIIRGEDPSLDKQRARRLPDEDTCAGLFRIWLNDYARKRRKTWETDAARLLADPDDVEDDDAKQARRQAPIRRLHPLRPGHDRREDVEDVLIAVHAEISDESPVTADRAVQTVQACLNWHVRRRNIPASFKDIAELVDFNGSESREDHIRPSELAQFAAATADRPVKWRCALWLMLLTGSRSSSEALSLRWSDVRLDVGEIVYPETKNGSSHTLPITPAVRAILETLPRTSEWVFPRRRGDGPALDARKQFKRIRSAGFVDHITPHALRHTARTMMETKLRIPQPTVDAVLNHSTAGMAGTYTHVTLDDMREALVELEAYVLEQAGIADFAEFVTEPGRA